MVGNPSGIPIYKGKRRYAERIDSKSLTTEGSRGGRRRKRSGPTFIMPAAGAALATPGGSLSAELSRLVPAELPETEHGELRSSRGSTAAAAPSSCGGMRGGPCRGDPEGGTQGVPSAIPPPGAPSSRTGPARQEYSAAAPVAPSALCVSSHQALPLLLRRQRALLASICSALPAKEGGSDAGNDRGDATAARVEGWPGRGQAKHGRPSQSLRPRVVEPRAPVQAPRHVSPRLCRALNLNVRLERRHPPSPLAAAAALVLFHIQTRFSLDWKIKP